MAFSNPKTEEYANKLEKAGLLDANARRRLEVDEGIAARDQGVARKYISDDSQITVEQVMDIVGTKIRTTDYEILETINKEYSVDTPERKADWQTKLADWTGENLTPGRVAAFAFLGPIGGASTVAAGEALGQASISPGSGADLGIREERTAVKDFYRFLEESGYQVSRPDTSFFPEAAMYGADVGPDTLKAALEYASNQGNVPPEVIDFIMEQVEEAALVREQDRLGVEDELIENEEIDRTNEENPLYAKNLAAFEILDNAAPTKYKFDQASGAIYLTETGGQVDRRGKELDPTNLEAGAELVGGWPEGHLGTFTPAPQETGWGQLSLQSGVTVDEYAYNDMLDVINNKEWYGADASRYVAGQAGFLGGYDSTYRVKVEEAEIAQRARAAGASNTNMDMGFYVFSEMDQRSQSVRRPWYDQNDNWAQFAGLSPENVAAVQSQLVSMGALEPDDIVYGQWGPTEAKQMGIVMNIANGQAVEWTDLDSGMLKEYFDSETSRTTPQRAQFTPPTFRPLDPARVEVTIRDSVRALIGRDPTTEDLQLMGSFLTDEYSSSYQADVAAGRSQYNAQIAGDEAGTSVTPGAVQDVDYDARFQVEMEKRFEPQIESQERGVLAGQQQDMGQSMSNLMNRLGGGIG